jgi:hypothetical protein
MRLSSSIKVYIPTLKFTMRMKFMRVVLRCLAVGLLVVLGGASRLHADIIVSEFHPTGSSNGSYAADWIELTNTGTSSVDLVGWRFDDNSNSFASSLELTGVASLAAGQSAVFIEGNTGTATAFTTAWFGANVPVGFTIGAYSGSGIGLGSGGDAINIYNAAGVLITNVTFGAATTGVTFDNSAGLTGPVTQLSVVGVNGAFNSVAGGEIGSPGFANVAAVPEPTTGVLVAAALAGFGFSRVRRSSKLRLR